MAETSYVGLHLFCSMSRHMLPSAYTKNTKQTHKTLSRIEIERGRRKENWINLIPRLTVRSGVCISNWALLRSSIYKYNLDFLFLNIVLFAFLNWILYPCNYSSLNDSEGIIWTVFEFSKKKVEGKVAPAKKCFSWGVRKWGFRWG